MGGGGGGQWRTNTINDPAIPFYRHRARLLHQQQAAQPQQSFRGEWSGGRGDLPRLKSSFPPFHLPLGPARSASTRWGGDSNSIVKTFSHLSLSPAHSPSHNRSMASPVYAPTHGGAAPPSYAAPYAASQSGYSSMSPVYESASLSYAPLSSSGRSEPGGSSFNAILERIRGRYGGLRAGRVAHVIRPSLAPPSFCRAKTRPLSPPICNR